MSNKRREARAQREEERANKIFRNIIIVMVVLAVTLIAAFSIFL